MSKRNAPQQAFALAIYASDHGHNPPVVYDLTGAPIDIGSAENNHIVLNGRSVEPYHLAIREARGEICAVIDLRVARRHVEQFWLERRSRDTLLCREHGRLPEHASQERCPICDDSERPILLLRPLQPGDSFSIGDGFEASVLSQANAQLPAANPIVSSTSPWPETDWLEDPPRYPVILLDRDESSIEERAFPLNDSNLWVWDPPESPIPVFIHQRVNRYTTQHARGSPKREVGGLLLGHIYRAPDTSLIYPVITHAISARYATESRGHLTFTHQTWLDFIRQREERFTREEVLGWYHTHPGLDIFLSEWDLTIHRNFFREPWQVAMVLDPRQDQAGLFVWRDHAILDPLAPHQPFWLADTDDVALPDARPRVRIKLTEERVL